MLAVTAARQVRGKKGVDKGALTRAALACGG